MNHAQPNTFPPSKVIDSTANADAYDEVYTILSNSRRRFAIRIMLEAERMDKGTLADRVSEAEFNKPIEEISSKERQRVYVALVQSHLTKLEESNIVKMENNTVKLGERASEIANWLPPGESSLTARLKRSLMALC